MCARLHARNGAWVGVVGVMLDVLLCKGWVLVHINLAKDDVSVSLRKLRMFNCCVVWLGGGILILVYIVGNRTASVPHRMQHT